MTKTTEPLPPATAPAQVEHATQLTSAPRRHGRWLQLVWPLAALALLLLYNAWKTPGFFHVEVRHGEFFGSVIDILNRGTPVMLLALGMTLVIATGGIDLSVGAVMAITGTVAAVLITRHEGSPLAGLNLAGTAAATEGTNVTLGAILAIIAVALLTAALAGLWNGVLVAFVDIQPIVATLILMVAGRGVAQLVTNGDIVTFHNEAFEFLGTGTLFHLPFTITIVAVTAILIALLTRGTALGLFIESVGNNPVASRYSGINARTVKLATYIVCGICAGLAGMIQTADIKAADANNMGLYFELDAILAVAIGGTSLAGGRFSLLGAIIGTLVIQTLTTTILTRGVDPSLTLVIKAGVVVGVCLLQSDNLRGMVLRVWKRST